MKPGRLKRQQQVPIDDHVEIPLIHKGHVTAPLTAAKLAESGDFPRLLVALALRPRLARATDAFGMTALHWACSEPMVSPRVVLTVARAHPAAAATRNLAGLLPLHLAVRKRLVLEAIQALLHVYPKAIGMRTPDGKTSLMMARQRPMASSAVLTLLEVLEAHARTGALSSVGLPTSQWPEEEQQVQLQKHDQGKERGRMRMSEGFSLSRSSIQEETLAAMMTPHVPPPRWALALKCRLCAAKFGYFRKRHHCRSCGASVCGRHSRHRVPLKHLGLFQPQRVCECCFGEFQKQLHVRASERVSCTGVAYPYIDNDESNSMYPTNSMSMRARYRRRSKSVYSEPAKPNGPNEWCYDYDNDSEASTNGFASVSAPWSTASLEAVECLQPEINSMFVSFAPPQSTVLSECRHLLREHPRNSTEPEPTRWRSKQRRSRPHSSALDELLHVQRLSEVESGCSSDEQEMEQRMQQLATVKRELEEVTRCEEENFPREEGKKLELAVVANTYWGKGYSVISEDEEDEDEEAEIAATFVFMNGGRRMSCTADLLRELEPPHDVGAVHCKLGEILLRKGDFTGAVVELRRSIELCDNNAVAWLYLAKALDSLGMDNKATEGAVRRALELEPASIGALSLLGKLLHLRGDHDNAILVFREALKLQCPTGNLPGHAAENDTEPLSMST